jgi:UDP-N-acetyl-D-glucosamine dehydrogenase
MSSPFTALLDRVRERQALVAVIGLGFVGIPEALAIGRAGFRVIGIDRQPERIDVLRAGRPIVPDVTSEELRDALGRGSFVPTFDERAAHDADVVVIGVPTPITPLGNPDLGAVATVTGTIGTFPRRSRLVKGEHRSRWIDPLRRGGRIGGSRADP